jgi:hypothetical protein
MKDKLKRRIDFVILTATDLNIRINLFSCSYVPLSTFLLKTLHGAQYIDAGGWCGKRLTTKFERFRICVARYNEKWLPGVTPPESPARQFSVNGTASFVAK